jgi:hypothetical protein
MNSKHLFALIKGSFPRCPRWPILLSAPAQRARGLARPPICPELRPRPPRSGPVTRGPGGQLARRTPAREFMGRGEGARPPRTREPLGIFPLTPAFGRPARGHPSLNHPRHPASIARPARASSLTAHARRPTSGPSRHSRPLSPSAAPRSRPGRQDRPRCPRFPGLSRSPRVRRHEAAACFAIAAKRSSAIPSPAGPVNTFCESRKLNGNSLREWVIRWWASAAERGWQTVISAQKNTFATARDFAEHRTAGTVRPAREQPPAVARVRPWSDGTMRWRRVA